MAVFFQFFSNHASEKSNPLRYFSLISLILFISCASLLFPRVDKSQASTMRVADPELTNEEYARRLFADGWPVDTLNTAANDDYLDDDEKNIILAHNLVRYDPGKFSRLYVTEYISYFQGNRFYYPDINTILLTKEGSDPARELYFELLKANPMDLLYPSKGLSGAAKSHVQYLCERGIRGHRGQGGLPARIEQFGTWDNIIAENIAYGSFSAHDAVLYLLIDDHVFDRSHRKIILNPSLHLVGVAKDRHPFYPTGYSYVINYAFSFNKHDKKSHP